MNSRLLACVVSRRVAGIAVFLGGHLEYTKARQLSSDMRTAERAISALLHHVADHFSPRTLMLNIRSESPRNRALAVMAKAAAMQREMTIWEVESSALLLSYGEPALTSQSELRNIVGSLWPVLNDPSTHDSVLDSAALGFYGYCEQLLESAQANHV